MHTTLQIRLDNAPPVRCRPYLPVQALARPPAGRGALPPIGARVNNDIVSLTYPLDVDADVRWLTMADPHGMRIYRQTLMFLLAKTAAACCPGQRLRIEHSLGTGLFCQFERPGAAIHRRQVAALETALRALVARNVPIRRLKLAYADALARLLADGAEDQAGWLRFRNPPKVVLFECEGFADLAHGPLAPATGALRWFRLIPYPPGLVLQLPTRETPTRVAPFRDQPQLVRIFKEHKRWGRILRVSNVGQLNARIAAGGAADFIRIAEALHEKKIAGIADRIAARRQVRLILISGPSAAGKTTFAKRLRVQLAVNGLDPLLLSLDDYYRDDADTPRDADGRPDYESIDALDLATFRRHLLDLFAGRAVRLPRFDFDRKRRAPGGPARRLGPGQVVIAEGIHALNPRLTAQLPARCRFGIYVSALTQLALDANNRISTTDNRLMRRLVRDRAFRGNPPLTTLRMWPSVRRGEKRWVFPFQARAQATFNSALDYELAVLKPLVEPLLLEIKPSDPEYAEARRLQEFLLPFLPIVKHEVPATSILREYIGASGFQY